MGRLTDTVREQVAARGKQVPVPDWLPRFSIGVGVVLAVVVTVQALFGFVGGEPEVERRAPRQYIPPAVTSTVPDGPTTTVLDRDGGPVTSPSTVAPAPTGTVTVSRTDGGVAELDAAAVDIARRAAAARFTGEFSGIPTLGAPSGAGRPGAEPRVTTIQLQGQEAGRLEFLVGVEPSPRSTVEAVEVVVVVADEQWRWLPE